MLHRIIAPHQQRGHSEPLAVDRDELVGLRKKNEGGRDSADGLHANFLPKTTN